MTARGRMLHRAIILTLLLVAALGITACDLLQPEDARSTTWDSSCPLAVPPGAAPRNPAGGSPQLARICFVPLGEPKTLDLPALAAHYKQRFGVTVGILPAITPGPGEFDQTRRQFVGEDLIAFMRKSYASLDIDRSTLLIGFTESDMYLRSTPSWGWAFAQRVGSRSGVIATARMDTGRPRQAASAELLNTRARKMTTKTIGLLYFGLPRSTNPKSVLFDSILGVDDLDTVGEEF